MKSILITYSTGTYNPITKAYDPINPQILDHPLVKDSIIFDTHRRTIYAQGLEFGNNLTFSYMNTGSIEGIATNVSKAPAYYITGITQNIDGSITYTYSYAYSGTNIYLEGWSQNTSPSNSYVNSIVVNGDGSISYKYGIINHSSLGNSMNPGESSGVITNINLDSNGNLSYDYTSLANQVGSYAAPVTNSAGNTANKLPTNGTTAFNVITGISQTNDGKLSYTYTALTTSALDYKYHTMTLTNILNADGDDLEEDTVRVIKNMKMNNSGLTSTGHTISYESITVPTKYYIDTAISGLEDNIENIIATSDALKYSGLIIPSSHQDEDCGVTDNYSGKGAVYKVKYNGYIGNEYVSPGDMIICNTDDAEISNNSNNISGTDINSQYDLGDPISYIIKTTEFSNWDIINENINLISQGKSQTNSNNAKRVLTSLKLYDDGRLSYTYYTIDYKVLNKTLVETPSTYEYNVISSIDVTRSSLTMNLSYSYMKISDKHVQISKDENTATYLIGTTTKVDSTDIVNTVNSDSKSYLLNQTLYVEKENINSELIVGNSDDSVMKIQSKNISFVNENKIKFTGLKALWGEIQIN